MVGFDIAATAAQAVVSGLVVVLGIVLAAELDRRRRRRLEVEDALVALSTPYNRVVTGLVDSDAELSYHSPFQGTYDEAIAQLHRIQLHARGFRGADDIRKQARLVVALLITAATLRREGKRISPLFITETGMGELRRLIFGDDDPMNPEALNKIEERIERLPFPSSGPFAE